MGRSIDAIAHLGGLVGGLLISLALLQGFEGKNRRLTYIGIVGIVLMNLTSFLVLFLAR
jgi:membrane associated rhomboid family serine protease